MKQKKLFGDGFNLKLPLWHRAIFIDWHGVLCNDVFWWSILKNPKHRLHNALSLATKNLFERSPLLLNEWLKGQISTTDLVDSLSVGIPKGYKNDYLLRRLSQDCKSMNINLDLFKAVKGLATSHFVVLATDNMDCLVREIEKRMESTVFDAILCSSALGTTKSECPDNFFGPWLRAHKVEASATVLIDDSIENCQEFETLGGTAILHQSVDATIEHLRRWAGVC